MPKVQVGIWGDSKMCHPGFLQREQEKHKKCLWAQVQFEDGPNVHLGQTSREFEEGFFSLY